MALDWKWLFIYPDQGIAAVNQLVMPAGTPVRFRLTSATVMNSFFVPQLGSQIYTMGGHDHPPQPAWRTSPASFRVFRRISAATALPRCGSSPRRCRPAISMPGSRRCAGSGSALDDAGYAALAKPSKAVPPTTYRSVEPKLFERIIDQTMSGPEKARAGAAWCPPAQQAGG